MKSKLGCLVREALGIILSLMVKNKFHLQNVLNKVTRNYCRYWRFTVYRPNISLDPHALWATHVSHVRSPYTVSNSCISRQIPMHCEQFMYLTSDPHALWAIHVSHVRSPCTVSNSCTSRQIPMHCEQFVYLTSDPHALWEIHFAVIEWIYRMPESFLNSPNP